MIAIEKYISFYNKYKIISQSTHPHKHAVLSLALLISLYSTDMSVKLYYYINLGLNSQPFQVFTYVSKVTWSFGNFTFPDSRERRAIKTNYDLLPSHRLIGLLIKERHRQSGLRNSPVGWSVLISHKGHRNEQWLP